MYILTIITKRSCREIIPQAQMPLFISKREFVPGSVIEIIDGNRKSLACIVNCEPVSVYKQEIRSGSIEPKKLKLSKTGDNADGLVMFSYDPAFFLDCLANNNTVKDCEDAFIRSFFPTKRGKKRPVVTKRKKVDSFKEMSLDRYFNNKPTHHSRMHELVDTIRNYFGDKAAYGQGSFSYYLGFFKRIPDHEVQRMFEEAKRSNKDIFGQKKLFWWKIGQYIRPDEEK